MMETFDMHTAPGQRPEWIDDVWRAWFADNTSPEDV